MGEMGSLVWPQGAEREVPWNPRIMRSLAIANPTPTTFFLNFFPYFSFGNLFIFIVVFDLWRNIPSVTNIYTSSWKDNNVLKEYWTLCVEKIRSDGFKFQKFQVLYKFHLKPAIRISLSFFKIRNLPCILWNLKHTLLQFPESALGSIRFHLYY